jgi:hypothetical protein
MKGSQKQFLFMLAFWVLLGAGVSYASTPITYFVYKESIGLYQSPNLASEANQFPGFFNEVVAKVFEGEDVDIEVVVMPALRVFSVINDFEGGTWIAMGFDNRAISSSEVVNIDLDEITQNPITVASFTLSLFHLKDGPIVSVDYPALLKNKRVLTLSSSRYPQFEKAFKGMGVRLIKVKKYSYALKMLMAGRADYLLSGDATVRWNMKAIGENLDILRQSGGNLMNQNLNSIQLVWRSSMPPELEQRMREKLKFLEASGWMSDLRKQYGVADPRM